MTILANLKRITSGGRFVPEIDGLRFIAILSVILFHLYAYLLVKSRVQCPTPWVNMMLRNGDRGVRLFFVISGFILGLPFAAHYLGGRPRVSISRYFIRRLTRLEPPYILNILVCFALLLFGKGANAMSLFPHALASLIYLHDLIFGAPSTINAVAWSLEVEVQFYLLAPLLSMVFAISRKYVRRGFILSTMLCLGLLQLIWIHSFPSTISILYFLQFFLAGFVLADIYVSDWKETPPRSWKWDVLSVLGWPLAFLLPEGAIQIALPFLMLLLICASFRSLIFRYFFRLPAVTTIGGMCYSIYLFHYQITSAAGRLTSTWLSKDNFYVFFAAQLLIIGACILLVSTVFFVLVERPCMQRDWPQRLANKFRRHESLSAGAA